MSRSALLQQPRDEFGGENFFAETGIPAAVLDRDIDGNGKILSNLKAIGTDSMLCLEAFGDLSDADFDWGPAFLDAIAIAHATGAAITVGAGTFKVKSPVVSTKPIALYCLGRDLTNFLVTATFSDMGALGIFQFTSTAPGLPELSRQQYAFRDFTVTCEQPESSDIADMIHYPYVFHLDQVGSVDFRDVTLVLPWNGVRVTNSSGGAITGLYASPLNIGVYLDTTFNNLAIHNYKSWIFEGSDVQNSALSLSPSIQALVIVHADFLSVTSSLFYAGKVVRSGSWEGTVKFIGCTFDQTYGIVHAAGRTTFLACEFLNNTPADASLSGIAFTVTGGQVLLMGCLLAAGNSLYPFISINWTQTSGIGGNFFNVIGGDLSFGDPAQDVNFIRVTGTNGLVNYVTIRGAHIFRSNKSGGGSYGEAFVYSENGTATNVVHFTGNQVAAMGTGNSPLLTINEDGAHVIQLGDLPTGWTNNFPAVFCRARIDGYVGGAVASAGTITASARIFPVSGVAAIATLNLPTGLRAGEQIVILPTGIFTWTTGGNFVKAGAAVVGQALVCIWNGSKWATSY